MRLNRNPKLLIRKNGEIYQFYGGILHIIPLTAAHHVAQCGINVFTLMPPHSDPQAKRQALQASGTFNPRHDRVRHPLFQQSDFFDPRDLLQLKYETLRALKQDGYSIARAAADFGLSRPTIYQTQDHFQQRGLEGLLPAKPGPKQPHKLTVEVRGHLQQLIQAQPQLGARELARRVRQRFQVKLHPRTIEKDLKTKTKRGRQKLT
jgi:transposase